MPNDRTSRREFLRQTACSAVGYSAMVSTILDLYKLNAAAQGASDYKALVCVFLYGGNDSNNLLVPRDAGEYAAYAGPRGSLAIAPGTLLPITPANAGGRTFGFHPSMPEMQSLFGQGRATVLCNVGPLVAPLTKTQYSAGGSAVPRNLFSHDDQQVLWQTSVADRESPTGWGGRTADLLRSLNDAGTVSMVISLSGRNTFQVGRDVFQYQVSPFGGSSGEAFGDSEAESRAAEQILAVHHQNIFENAYRDTLTRVVENQRKLSAALASAPALTTLFPNSYLGRQLAGAARLIAARSSLGHRRQIFFCSAGGYDTHGAQLQSHAGLLAELSTALGAFYGATVELGVSQQVTAFTASDFGRTLVTNGSGSDHGWGSHHLIVGGAVRGGRLYGQYPNLAVNGPDDTGDGRWIPTTSVDEYSSTLARWFGVGAPDMALVLPNIGRFNAPDLGFLG